MKEAKTSTSFKNIKDNLSALTSKQLVQLIGELYDLNQLNQSFLNARFLKNEASLKNYKSQIRRALYPDFDSGKQDISFSKARKAISDFAKATSDRRQTLDLMVYYVEVGKEMMDAFGMDYEAFYDSMESMFRKIVERLKNQDRHLIAIFWDRLKKVERAAQSTGYGYGDSLREMMTELAKVPNRTEGVQSRGLE